LYTGPKILLNAFLSKMFICFLSLAVSIQVSDAYVKVLSIVMFFSLNFSFLDVFISKIFCNLKYVFLAFFILSCKSIWCFLSFYCIYFLNLIFCSNYVLFYINYSWLSVLVTGSSIAWSWLTYCWLFLYPLDGIWIFWNIIKVEVEAEVDFCVGYFDWLDKQWIETFKGIINITIVVYIHTSLSEDYYGSAHRLSSSGSDTVQSGRCHNFRGTSIVRIIVVFQVCLDSWWSCGGFSRQI